MRSLRWLVRFWSTDRGLSALLGSLVAIIFVVPLLQSLPAAATLLVQILFTLVFVSGISTITPSRAARVVGIGIFTAAIALNWLDYVVPQSGLGVLTALGRILAVSLLTVLVVRQVFREGPITVQRIEGAVAVYLLLGLAWGGIYQLIGAVWPDAFRFSEAPRSRPELANALAYYSFVTLTTMGYGDITPVHPAARSAAILEALTGQLFPAILIGRLVAMELAARERRDR
jgi:ion channel